MAATAFASDGPRSAADQLLSAESSFTTEQIRRLVAEVERDEPTSELAQTLHGLDEFNLARCNEHFYRDLIARREQHLNHLPLVRYFTDVMRRQRKWCENYMDSELRRRVGQFSAQTQEYLKLFMSRDLVGRDFYQRPDNSINKLRQFVEEAGIESREAFEAQFGERFFGACREINSLLAELVAIRQEHEIFATLPRSSDRYFRVNSFCKNLVNFDLLDAINEILFADKKARNTLIKFGRYFEPEDEINFQLASDVALKYATDYEIAVRKHANSAKMQPLNKRRQNTVREVLRELRAACDSSLERLENLIWLLQFAGVKSQQLTVNPTDSHEARLESYLRTVNACQQIPTLNIENLLHRHQQHLLEHKWSRSSFLVRTFSRFGNHRTSAGN